MDQKPDLKNSQLFLDDRWIERSHHVQRKWHRADIYAEPMIRPTEPWEGYRVYFVGTAAKDAGFEGFRIYYAAFTPEGERVICLAESEDGLKWNKPRLGLYEWRGNKDNNIVFRDPALKDGGSLAHDPGGEYPYWLFYYTLPPRIYAARSKDGIHFERIETPVLDVAGDRHFVMFNKVDGKFVLTCRHLHWRKHTHARSVWISTSENGLSFSEPELVLYPDLLDAPLTEYYGMPAFPYGDLYIGLLEYWYQEPDQIEVVVAWSDDLRQWNLPPGRNAFIAASHPWNAGWIGPGSGPPILVGNRLWIYFNGRPGAHLVGCPNNAGVIGLASAVQDRFCSIVADAMPGSMLLKPMTWPGGDLCLNVSTTRYANDGWVSLIRGGSQVKVEVFGADGQPIEGFGEAQIVQDNRPRRSGSELFRVRWGEKSLDALSGKTIRLQFTMCDAHLFSFKAG